MTPEFFEANWPFMLIVLLVVLVIGWLWLSANRTTSVVSKDKKDVLDEGAAPAQRNQALIDAPKAAMGDTPAPAPPVTPVPQPTPAPAPEPTPAPEPVAPIIDADPAPPVLGEAPAEPAPAPPAAPSTASTSDDLTVIKGLGPKLSSMLEDHGITSYAQIAAWDDTEIDRVDALLDRFKGRIRRDNWVEQAKLLAAGDEAGFASKFGQNG
ncbi:MAG: hypothetical protein AAGL68_09685 [Pseudomonadota bacterium]